MKQFFYSLPLIALLSACGASIQPMQPRLSPQPETASGDSGEGRAPGTVYSDGRIPAADAEFFSLFTLMVPVVGVAPHHLTDTYHHARSGGRIHRATDIMAPRGTPVVAAVPGVILRISDNPLGGKTIYQLDQVSRYLYYYAHLDSYARGLKVGQTVEQGQLLGYVGSTGNATTPHLHFQGMRWDPNRRDYWNAEALDVRPFFSLSGEELR